MAIPGRKPKPTALKILEGNPGKRPLNENEPIPQSIVLIYPEWLNDRAKDEWKRTAPILERLKILTEADRTIFTGYCQTYAMWEEAVMFLQENGTTYQYIKKRDKKGKAIDIYIAPFPQVAIARYCMDQLIRLCAEFGLTPSSRGRINLPGETPEDEMEKLLSKINS